MFATIYLPDFFLQAALRHQPELLAQPVALLHEETKTIFQLTALARAAGVTEGLTSTQALARCSNVLVQLRSVPREISAMDLLLQCAYAFSPNIEATAPGVCTMDLRGLSHAGTKGWAEKMIQELASLHLRAQVGVAENPDLALCAAKMARGHVLSEILDRKNAERSCQQEGAYLEKVLPASRRKGGDEPEAPTFIEAQDRRRPTCRRDADSTFLLVEDTSEFIKALPIESLEPSAEICSILERWGVRTLGEFTALQKDQLAERLGMEALELFDRALARKIRPLNLVRPREVFEEAIEFENEIETLQPLLFIIQRFIEQLSRRLELFSLVAEEIQLRLTLSENGNGERETAQSPSTNQAATTEKLESPHVDSYECTMRVPAATRNVTILFRMVQTHLESVRTESSIVALHLAIKPGREEHVQFGLFETALRDPNRFYEMLAQLNSLLGPGRVGTPVCDNTHRPDAFQIGSTNFERKKNFEPDTVEPELATGLPLRRFRPPLPALVEMRHGKPAILRSEKFVGAIAKVSGPFRSSGNWWEKEQLWNRDEWDIETAEGELFRIFAENNEWFLEGVFD